MLVKLQKENKKKVKLLKDSNSRVSLLVLLVFTLFYSCSSSRYSGGTTSNLSNQRSEIVRTARKQIGDKYKYSAKGPNNFDCSGLVSYVYNNEGVSINGSASSMYSKGKSIPLQKASPGDLVFYKKGGRIFHVSIVSRTEKGKLWVIHSTSSRGVIEEDVLASLYWKPMIYKTVTLSSYK